MRATFTDSTAAEQQCPAADSADAARQRKRGAALERAIQDAVFAELADVGYAGFTIEAVAARAQTGKASIYRRWPTKHDLVLAAFVAKLGTGQAVIQELMASDYTTRDILVALGRQVIEVSVEMGEAFRAVACEVTRNPELADAIDRQVHCPKRDGLVQVLRRGVARGEVRPEAACEMFAEVLPALIMHQIVLMNRPVTDQVIADTVDRIVMPLLRPTD